MEEKIIHEEIEQEESCCGHDHEHHHDHDHEHGHHHEHEHHHDHEHEHHHGHEHHHDHDHEHDEHCGCGHDHDHEHHHDHDHDHDHEHDHEHHHHDHGHQYEVAGFRIMETHNHEGATICSFEKDIMADAAVVEKMKGCINDLAKWLDETDSTIGHVKGYVKESGPVTTFSTVGCGLNVEQHEGGSQMMIGFAAIVFGPTEEELKDKVTEIFSVL